MATTDTGATTPMPQYQSHKKVWALKITSVEQLGTDTSTYENPIVRVHFEPPFSAREFNLYGKPHPLPGWYMVQYEDGYISFSPGKAFEEGNSLIVQPVPAEPRDLRSFDQATIDNWFTYHAPTPEQLVQYREIRTAAKIFAETINRHVPGGADKTAAIRKVREATMTANAAIACAD
jgi:hypothetical protein